MAIFSKYQNPRSGQTYSGEDFVGRVAKVAASVVLGVGSLKVGTKIVRKLLRALLVRFSRRGRRW